MTALQHLTVIILIYHWGYWVFQKWMYRFDGFVCIYDTEAEELFSKCLIPNFSNHQFYFWHIYYDIGKHPVAAVVLPVTCIGMGLFIHYIMRLTRLFEWMEKQMMRSVRFFLLPTYLTQRLQWNVVECYLAEGQ